MHQLRKHLLSILCLLFTVGVWGQIPQELVDKAKQMGMTEEQIQQEIMKYLEQNTSTTTLPQQTLRQTQQPALLPADATTTGLRSPLNDNEIPPAELQREDNRHDKDPQEMVFGRDIFSDKNLTFEPDLNIPTPKNYRFAAGDEVLIHVWGDSEMNLQRTISPDGTIFIPDLGPVALSGLTVEEARDRIRRQLGRIMETIDGHAPNTFVSVSLGQIRSIKVNIVGEAEVPGTYTLTSLATLFNALYAAGGVNDIGSLRSIKVYRNSRLAADLDVYRYLLHGAYETDIRLEDNDMVMIGPYDMLVTARGKIKRNRIFELKKDETLADLLDMAGGFTGDAYTKDVTVKRKSGTGYQIATVAKEQFATFTFHDGDSLLVDSVVAFYENRLTVTGAVWRPGEYELSPSVHTVRQLVKQAAGLKGDEFAGRALVTRLNPDFTHSVIAIPIGDIMTGAAPDMELQNEDRLYIPSLFDLREPYTIRVEGAVNMPDTILPYRRGMTVEDAIVLAGGLQEAAATVNVEVARRIKDDRSAASSEQIARVYKFTLRDALQTQPADTLFTLEPFDEVYVRFSPGYQKQQVVNVGGEIMFAGSYALPHKNTRLSDLIREAGGITPGAYVKGANLKRKLSEDEIRQVETLLQLSNANKEGKDSIALSMADIRDYPVGINLEKALEQPGSAEDLVLRDGDALFIPQLQSTVKISGAVTYPNSVTYARGMTVRDCLSQAGGYNELARKYPVVIYMNGQVATTRRVALFFKRYPPVEPGSEIVVPAKSPRDRRANLAEILSISSSATSMAAVIASIINTIKR